MARPRLLALLAVTGALLTTAGASGHPEHGLELEEFPGEGVLIGSGHRRAGGGLPATRRNVRLVGKAAITNPSGAGSAGRVADVAAYGNYAYLTAFREPTCAASGAHTIDISDPTRPEELPAAFMPSAPGNYAGEGAQTLPIRNSAFAGVVFVHQNETCPNAGEPTEPRTRGGINIWDISDPRSPVLLVAHAGDYTGAEGEPQPQANQTHSMFAWNATDGRTYVGLMDIEETTNVDILDISDPRRPHLVNDTLDLTRPPFSVRQATPANLTTTFAHDLTVRRIGRRDVMVVNYWDGGYVLLDVTFPRAGGVTLIAQSDFPSRDGERLARGQRIPPEGNAHQSELSPDNAFLLGTEEDFAPFRTQGRVTDGPYAGAAFFPTSAAGAARVEPALAGRPTFVGEACSAVPRGTGLALAERGTCTFQEKLDAIKDAGYTAAIVFNSGRDDCLSTLTMSVSSDIPYLFVSRLAGLQLLQMPAVRAANACSTAAPAPGTSAASVTVETVFDGWGYVRLLRTRIPGQVGAHGAIAEIDTYSLPEAQRPSHAVGFGTLSVHEVAVDPRPRTRLAYVSHYAGGLRVLEYGRGGLREVGAFIDVGGNDFWGVEVHRVGGRQYVLASDRSYGLYVLQYTKSP